MTNELACVQVFVARINSSALRLQGIFALTLTMDAVTSSADKALQC